MSRADFMSNRFSRKDVLVFLGVPTSNSLIDIGTAKAVLKASRTCQCACQFNSASLLANNFNTLYCNALSLRRGGMPVTHFCLLHSDIVPDSENWLNEMIAEMDKHDLQVISSVVPIKDGRGITSTAMCMSEETDTVKWRTRRITLHEVMTMPTTFNGQQAAARLKGWDHPTSTLLINTGLMLIDLRCKHAEQLFFTINDGTRVASVEGHGPDRIIPVCEPEDWGFSRLLASLNIPYAATKVVGIKHAGRFDYDSRISWGHELDPALFPLEVES